MSFQIQQNLEALLAAGGPVVAVLLLLSVTALAVILLKLVQYASLRLGQRVQVETALGHWAANRPMEAIATLQGVRQPLAELVLSAMQGRRQNLEDSLVREEVARLASAQLESLRSHLRILEVVGIVSPLLGLFGTVLGMIEAFQQMELAGSQVDPGLLSGGIWQALLTTAVGLGVAIPAVLAHNWLERRVESYAHLANDAVTRVFTRPVSVSHAGHSSAAAPQGSL